jgi:antitoxin HigA-1
VGDFRQCQQCATPLIPTGAGHFRRRIARQYAGFAETGVKELEFLKPLGISQNQLARDIGVPASRISEIVLGRRGITADTAARLAVFFRTTVDFWINLQARYDAKMAARNIVPELRGKIRPHRDAA